MRVFVCVYTMSQPPPPLPSSPLNPHVQRISRLANTSVKVFNISTVMTDLHAGQSADEHAIRFLLSEKVTSVSTPGPSPPHTARRLMGNNKV